MTFVFYRMAAKHGLKLVHQTPFADFFNQHIHTSEGRGLISRMQALEVRHSHKTRWMADLTETRTCAGTNCRNARGFMPCYKTKHPEIHKDN